MSTRSVAREVVEVLRSNKTSLLEVFGKLHLLQEKELGVSQTARWAERLMKSQPIYLPALAERLGVPPQESASILAQLVASVYNAVTLDGSPVTEDEVKAIEKVIMEDKYSAPFEVQLPGKMEK